jgi:DNA-binding transcriptional ArsR family regulator
MLEQLFPVVRAEIIRSLFPDPTKELYVRELARRADLALRTVQQELASLSALGLVQSRSNGYHRFYRANRRHPAFRALQQLAAKDQTNEGDAKSRKRQHARRRSHDPKRPRSRGTLLSTAGIVRRIT